MDLFLSEASNDELLAYEERLIDALASTYLKLEDTPRCHILARRNLWRRIDALEDKLSDVSYLLDSKVGVR